ncbi:hypothetical protein [Dendronalium sp. ChiSLP03b]|nr:hypothetical protein [Dendronalium sp. ChiSLP03b]MDZ8203982.1 hypothetical protein [Dendronalium sp. ChiSLP03b]
MRNCVSEEGALPEVQREQGRKSLTPNSATPLATLRERFQRTNR